MIYIEDLLNRSLDESIIRKYNSPRLSLSSCWCRDSCLDLPTTGQFPDYNTGSKAHLSPLLKRTPMHGQCDAGGAPLTNGELGVQVLCNGKWKLSRPAKADEVCVW